MSRYFATITKQRYGWYAAVKKEQILTLDDGPPFVMGWDIGVGIWRRTRKGAERAAGRQIRRASADEERQDASYEFVPKATA